MSRPLITSENLPLLFTVAYLQVPGIMTWTLEEVITLFTTHPFTKEEANSER